MSTWVLLREMTGLRSKQQGLLTYHVLHGWIGSLEDFSFNWNTICFQGCQGAISEKFHLWSGICARNMICHTGACHSGKLMFGPSGLSGQLLSRQETSSIRPRRICSGRPLTHMVDGRSFIRNFSCFSCFCFRDFEQFICNFMWLLIHRIIHTMPIFIQWSSLFCFLETSLM